MYRRFKKLDRSRAGVITSADLHLIPELSMSPLAQRVIALFTAADGTDAITFLRFVQTLNKLHPNGHDEERLDVIFEVLDVDGDGIISRDDLLQILTMLVGDHLEPDVVSSIVAETIQGTPKDRNGNITKRSAKLAVPHLDKLIVSVEANIEDW